MDGNSSEHKKNTCFKPLFSTTKHTLGENNIDRFLSCFVSTDDLAVQ